MGLSPLGIFHTVIGVIALIAATADYLRYGRINLSKAGGKIYFYFTLITAVTALSLSKNGGFNPGHGLSVLVLGAIGTAWYLHARHPHAGRARYWENFLLSFSFFLSMIPATNETLTRIPVGQPLAKDVTDPLVTHSLLVILLLFIAGTIYQFFQQRKVVRPAK